MARSTVNCLWCGKGCANQQLPCPLCPTSYCSQRCLRLHVKATHVGAAVSRPAAPRRPWSLKRLFYGVVTMGLLGSCCIGSCVFQRVSEKTAAELKEADRLYASGKKAAAVAKYKDLINSAADKAEVARRIVEYEVEQGNLPEAAAWAEQAIDLQIEVVYRTPASQELYARVKKERGEKIAARAADKARQELAAGVDLRIETQLSSSRQATVRGSTNLPPGTDLIVSVVKDGGDGFQGQEDISVGADGKFQVGPFGPEKGLGDGKYRAWVVMVLPRDQPDSVRRAIGEDGKHLKGSIVRNTENGITVASSRLPPMANSRVDEPPSREPETVSGSSMPGIYVSRNRSSGEVEVRGYYRKDGTYVQPHTRSAPGSRGGRR